MLVMVTSGEIFGIQVGCIASSCLSTWPKYIPKIQKVKVDTNQKTHAWNVETVSPEGQNNRVHNIVAMLQCCLTDQLQIYLNCIHQFSYVKG